jgi:tryptophanyl-tRNA synthetase
MAADTKKIDPWSSSDIENYRGLMDEFGIETFDKFKSKFMDNRYIRRDIIFGQRDFSRIDKAISQKKPWAMMTGLMPSGKFHFGHKMLADTIIWLQGLGGKIYVCSADIEAWLMRDITLEQGRKTAIEEYLTNYVALGLKLNKNLTFWFQSDYITEYYSLRDKLSKRVTFNEMKAIYGELSPGKIVSVLTQAADILHPQLNGPIPVVVPVGVDQDPHIRLTRDIASRLNADRETGKDFSCIPPSSTYHKFMRGLQGGKMSSSKPSSYIALTENPAAAKKKIMSAKTGGRVTAEEQKKLGGQPEACTVYDFFVYHLIDDDKELTEIYKDCTSGNRRCGDCKKFCAELMEKFLTEHQKKYEKAKKEVDEFMASK